jgi:hypothetical protein
MYSNIAMEFFLAKPTIIGLVVLAETASSLIPPEFAPLANLGAMGLVLLWFMWRLEPRLRKLEETIDRQTRMNGYVIIALESLSPAIKKQVDVVIKEVEDADALRQRK